MRARGLKHEGSEGSRGQSWSRPMRARGLKHHQDYRSRGRQRSRPMRARGLKHWQHQAFLVKKEVASHAGAWIETSTT